MLRLEGARDLPLPPVELWTKLSDARFLAQCLPGVESIASAEPSRVICILRPGFAFVRGTLELTLRVAEGVAANSLRVFAHTKGIGSTSDVEAAISLASAEGGTRLEWNAEIKELGGLLKAVPAGLIKAAAQKVIAGAWAALDARLAER